MICPVCHEDIPATLASCPSCGSPVAGDAPPVDGVEFIFCEGCGARLDSQERTCPKCGRPAPGILSTRSSASDLAAGKTASFPRLTSDAIASSVPAPAAGAPRAAAFDPDATSVLDAGDLTGSAGAGPDRARALVDRMPAPAIDPDAPDDIYRRPRRRAPMVLAGALLALGTVCFIAFDPLGVMPGLLDRIDRSASAMFPSRQVAEDADGVQAGDADLAGEGDAPVGEATLDDATAFQRLEGAYQQIVGFQDDLGPVIDDFNSWYIADDRSVREEGSRGAYLLRDRIGLLIEELDAMKLAPNSPYLEDVEHMRQLAGWMYNRVDVLCRSWDISLGIEEGQRPSDHQDEILRPLREVEMIDGKAVDVIEYERNVGAWKPREK